MVLTLLWELNKLEKVLKHLDQSCDLANWMESKGYNYSKFIKNGTLQN
jgi:hypothetical protein